MKHRKRVWKNRERMQMRTEGSLPNWMWDVQDWKWVIEELQMLLILHFEKITKWAISHFLMLKKPTSIYFYIKNWEHILSIRDLKSKICSGCTRKKEHVTSFNLFTILLKWRTGTPLWPCFLVYMQTFVHASIP